MRIDKLDPNNAWDAGWIAHKAGDPRSDSAVYADLGVDDAAWLRGWEAAEYFGAKRDA